MSRLRFCLLVAVLYSLHLGQGARAVTAPPKPEVIEVPHASTEPSVSAVLLNKNTELEKASSPADSTKNSSDITSTTEHTTTTSTEPTTTSTTPPTPTPSPPTPPTPKPTPPTPPTPKPTPPTPTPPTPAPGPLPPPEQGMWSYTDKKNNETCVIVQFAARLNVSYPRGDENATTMAHMLLNVPNNATVTNGSCDPVEQWITFGWPGTNSTNNTMTIVFHKNQTSNDYCLKGLNISLVPEMFYNSTVRAPVELYHGMDWRTPLATSYRCTPPTKLTMASDSPSNLTSDLNIAATLTLSRLQEEAFRTVNGTGFSSARECGGNDVPDAVPIAVGCALGGLVVVVVVAYMIARKRSAARGYLSM